MQPEIKTIEPITVFFVRRKGDYMKAAKEAWDELAKFIEKVGLAEKKKRSIGISHDDPKTTPEENLRYDACILVEENIQPEGEIKIQTIPGGAYAVFTHTGPHEKLKEIYSKIFREWLPTSGKKLRSTPMFEDYIACEDTQKDPEKWVTHIYVPIEE